MALWHLLQLLAFVSAAGMKRTEPDTDNPPDTTTRSPPRRARRHAGEGEIREITASLAAEDSAVADDAAEADTSAMELRVARRMDALSVAQATADEAARAAEREWRHVAGLGGVESSESSDDADGHRLRNENSVEPFTGVVVPQIDPLAAAAQAPGVVNEFVEDYGIGYMEGGGGGATAAAEEVVAATVAVAVGDDVPMMDAPQTTPTTQLPWVLGNAFGLTGDTNEHRYNFGDPEIAHDGSRQQVAPIQLPPTHPLADISNDGSGAEVQVPPTHVLGTDTTSPVAAVAWRKEFQRRAALLNAAASLGSIGNTGSVEYPSCSSGQPCTLSRPSTSAAAAELLEIAQSSMHAAYITEVIDRVTEIAEATPGTQDDDKKRKQLTDKQEELKKNLKDHCLKMLVDVQRGMGALQEAGAMFDRTTDLCTGCNRLVNPDVEFGSFCCGICATNWVAAEFQISDRPYILVQSSSGSEHGWWCEDKMPPTAADLPCGKGAFYVTHAAKLWTVLQ
jgi:hypothetical protein